MISQSKSQLEWNRKNSFCGICAGKTEGLRESLVNQTIAGTKLVMTVKGQSNLQTGDVIKLS